MVRYNVFMNKKYIDTYKTYAVTITLVAINTLLFLILYIIGNPESALFMLGVGAMFPRAITQDHEYYRLFTSMFLHFDFGHLLNNMLLLSVLGKELEPLKGKVRLIIVYVVSGVGGILVSLWINLRNQQQVVSGGASGAIFGIMGMLLGTLIKKPHALSHISKGGVIFMVVLSLYLGFNSTGVDNAAHVGGLIVGFLLGLIL